VGFIHLTQKIEKVKEFIRSYQETLRGLLAQLPTDGYIPPPRINSLVGKYEVWPCSDAAVVLTYGLDHSNASKDEVIVRDEINQTVDRFMKEGEPFVYLDETGQPGPVRLKFPFPKRQRADRRAITDDFLFVKFSLDTLTSWPRKGDSSSLNLNEQYFAPRFKRISIFGWNAHLGSGSEAAAKDFKAAFALRNCSNLLDPPSIAERIFQGASERLQELEKLVDQNDSKSVRDFIIEHPEVVRPDYLRAHTKVSIADQIVDLVLLLSGKDLPELVLIKFGPVEEAFFTDLNEASQTYLAAEADLKVLKEQIATDLPRIPLGSAVLSNANYQFIMGKSNELTYLQKKKLYEHSFGSSSQFHTYDDLINMSRYYLRDITEFFDRFLSVEARLERLGVKTEDDFNRLMEEIDREIQSENIPFTARSLHAWDRLSSVFWLSLTNQDPLSRKIFDWFNRRYGVS
jgi:hypothetical protein